MEMWQVAAAANVVVTAAYVAISVVILRPLLREGQLGVNRLGTATGIIFFTCAVGHAAHALHLIGPSIGVEEAAGIPLRATATFPHVFWEVITAAMGVYYWSLRRTYGALMKGAKLFEDMRERQRQALEINDNIVQGLFVAQTALALDEREVSEEALRSTLESARQIISDLLGEANSDVALGPGELVRKQAAEVPVRVSPGP
jgi:signal transduction histidine kinase